MRQLIIILLSGVLLITACGQPLAYDLSTPQIPATEAGTLQSFTSAPLPSKTPREQANEPTNTPRPPTPLPTIATFTPTFDASTISTVTPAPKAKCPEENPEIVTDFSSPNGYYYDEILAYLNSGGNLAQLAAAFSDRDPNFSRVHFMDLTGDGVSEIVYETWIRYDIFGCKDGKYQSVLDFGGDFGVGLEVYPDLNKNGIPELVLYDISHYGFVSLYVFEWHEEEFHSLINMGTDPFIDSVIDTVFMTAFHKLIDTNGDGLKEIVVVYDVNELCGGFGDFCNGTPARQQTLTLGWNGQNYVDLTQGNYAPPQYRFQAIQDGDKQSHFGNYAAALSFYQAAIFDDRLEWWSPEREEYEIYTYMAQFEPTSIAYPTPNFDNKEYPRLAAYAYYRIMLLHIVQGHESDAGTVYKTLQHKFGSDPYGHPYVELANAFWDTYQSTHKIYDGCASAIQYTAERPEILLPLGSDYHGRQSHTYVPADVCPFR